MAQVDIDAVSKDYAGNVRAVDGVSLTVPAGELMVLVGPSGCGKSTLLRMIAGLEQISAGEIRIGGKRVNETDPANRDIAMVFQNYALYPHMSVRQNMSYGLKNRGMNRAAIARRVDQTAAILQLGDFLDRMPRQLSGGQRQRVAMGRAIVREPAVFLFDEPLSNLDAKLRVEMRGEIRQLQRRLGTTSVYVTHDQQEAMTLADKLVVINKGRVEQAATPLEIFRNPQTVFVAGFIGSPAMNLLQGEASNQSIRIRDETIAVAPSIQSGKVTVGVRPHELRRADTAGAAILRVTHIEELGSERLVHGLVGGQKLVVALSPDEPVADRIGLDFTASRVHYFDPASGRRLPV